MEQPNKLSEWTLTLVMVQDPKIGGFTAFFKQFPDIITEGETEGDAVTNLMNTIHDVFKYQSEIEPVKYSSQHHIIQKSIHIRPAEYV